jgi:two-component system LytT family response regulator
MRVAIIEDEYVARHHLQSMLTEIDANITVEAALDSIEGSIRYFESEPQIDLVFMDIELGDGHSFNIFRNTTVDSPIIFITAYQEHALKAFKLNSVDYLLKPVDKAELICAISKYRKLYDSPATGRANASEGERMHAASDSREVAAITPKLPFGRLRYLAKSGTRLISVATENIAYFFTRDRMQYIKTVKGDEYIIDKRLDDIEAELNPANFFRANRQFILNYNNISKVHTWFSGKLRVSVSPDAYEEIIISRLRAADFKKWLGE